MIQEEKDLLLKDICARLPYGVFCKVWGLADPKKLIRIEVNEVDGVLLDFTDNEGGLPIQVYLSEVRPYLRPMSSMTNEERKYLERHYGFGYDTADKIIYSKNKDNLTIVQQKDIMDIQDFCDSHHLDWRGLIYEDLALEATKDMYNF